MSYLLGASLPVEVFTMRVGETEEGTVEAVIVEERIKWGTVWVDIALFSAANLSAIEVAWILAGSP